jgi:hypothetical protein
MSKIVNDFQELVRIMDSTLSLINPSGLINGENTLEIIKFLKYFPGMIEKLNESDPNFIPFMQEQFESSIDKENKRESVKKILTYPQTQYQNIR